MRRGARWLRRLRGEERAGITVMTAGALVMMIGFTSFAVDLGSLYVASRTLQGMADAAALAAASVRDGQEAAAQAAIDANRPARPVGLNLVRGRYRPHVATPAADRFQPGGVSPDAVRARLTQDAPLLFALAWIRGGTVPIARTATATGARAAAFSIGSRLAGFDGGVAGRYLEAISGTKLGLTAMDYRALAAAQIDLLAFAEALRTRVGTEAGSYDDLFAADVTTPHALGALADALRASGQGRAAEVAGTIASRLTGTSVSLSDLLDLGPLGQQDHAAGRTIARVSGYDLTRQLLQLAGGDRQAMLDLDSGVAGLGPTRVRISVGERPANSPWIAITDRGDVVVRTAQTRIHLDAQSPATAILSAVGLGPIRLPLFVEVAAAEARLAEIGCARANRHVTLDVRPGIGTLALADIDPARFDDHRSAVPLRPAQIASNAAVRVTAEGRARAGGTAWQQVRFGERDIAEARTLTVRTGDTGATLIRSLLADSRVSVAVLGLLPVGVGSNAVTAAVSRQLVALASPADALLAEVLGTLGVGLGEADVTVNGVRCGAPALVG